MNRSKLDEDFQILIENIRRQAASLSKHEKIRIDKWIEKLNITIINPVWKQNRNNYCKTLLNMLDSCKLEEPFNKLPPDGPLQKIKVPGQFRRDSSHSPKPAHDYQRDSQDSRDFQNLSDYKSSNLLSYQISSVDSKGSNRSNGSRALPESRPTASPAQLPQPSRSIHLASLEHLQRELEKSKERESLLREELMMSAKIISEQDKIISELRSKLNDGMMDDLNYLENLKNEADILAWSSELMLSQDEVGDSPSMDDIIPG